MGDTEREAAERKDVGLEDKHLSEPVDDVDPAEGEPAAREAQLNLIFPDEGTISKLQPSVERKMSSSSYRNLVM